MLSGEIAPKNKIIIIMSVQKCLAWKCYFTQYDNQPLINIYKSCPTKYPIKELSGICLKNYLVTTTKKITKKQKKNTRSYLIFQ